MTEAVLLVGGQGTRLRPLTVSTPKPMLPVAGEPFLKHVLARAAEAGVHRVVLATSYRAEVFEQAFGDGAKLGLELVYAVEDVPMGTGGAIRNAAAALRAEPDDPVLVFNGDVLSGVDLRRLTDEHVRAGADLTLHLTRVDDPMPFGLVPTNAEGRVTAFLEKPRNPDQVVTDQVNAGCYVFARRLVDTIPHGRPVSVEWETFPALLAGGHLVRGVVDTAYWLDLGTPEAYVQASCDLVLGRMSSPALAGPPGERLVQGGASVHPDAVVTGGSTVGAGASVGPGAVVHRSVLHEGARVEGGARVRDSVLARGAWVGAGAVLDTVVVGDHARVGPDNELLHGMRIWCDVELGPGAVRFSSDL